MTNHRSLLLLQQWRNTFAIGAIALASIVGFHLQCSEVGRNNRQAAMDQASSIRKSLDEAKAWLALGQGLDAERASEQLTLIDASRSSDSDPAQVFERIHAASSRCGVSVIEVSPLPSASLADVARNDRMEGMTLQATVTGDLAGAAGFLEEVRSVGNFVRLSGWSAIPIGTSDVPRIRLTVEIEILRFNTSERTAAGPTESTSASAGDE